MSAPEAFLCPHCLGHSGTCCLCLESRRLSATAALEAVRYVWRRGSCACDACTRAGSPPRQLADQIARHAAHAATFGPFDACEHTACVEARSRSRS